MNDDNEKNEYRDEKTGQFKEGNPGKPMGAKSHLKKLEEALEREAMSQDKTFYEKLAGWCFTRPSVAVAILKKFIPDMQRIESGNAEDIKLIIEHVNKKDLNNP